MDCLENFIRKISETRLYRDDSLAMFRNKKGIQSEKIKKKLERLLTKKATQKL